MYCHTLALSSAVSCDTLGPLLSYVGASAVSCKMVDNIMNSNPWKMEIGKILVEEHFLEFSTFKVIKAPSLLRRYRPHHDFHVGGRKNLLIFVKVSPDILTRPLNKQSVM